MKKVTNLHGTGLDWPDHPKDAFGDHLGAIVILQTLDNKILILRNDVLWGLPKGVRNYSEFHRIKTEFTESGEILKFDENYKFEQVESESDNICRETLEETGIVLDPEKLIRWAGEDDPSAYTKFFYQLNFAAADYHEILLKNGTDHENDEMKWIDREELSTLLQLHRSSRHSKIFNHVTFMFLSQWAKTYASQKI
jgi:8-oxo-dGTP pyrophosphatase MutT (NUDIX family)